MAQNYTLAEAVQIAAKKENVEAMNDLGRRYPLLMAKVYAVLAKAGDDAVDLLSYIPEKVSANKVNVQIKAAMLGGAEETEEGSDDSEDTAADEKKTMTKAERAKARREARKAAKAKAEAANEEEDDSEEADEAEDSDNPYEGKNAMELFKMCKERGIAAKPKRSAKFYADLLTKADAEAGEEDTDSEEDDWADDEEEQEEKPAKKTSKKASAKKATSKKAKAAEEDDEDEDWDI